MANNLNDSVNATNRSLAGTTQGLSDVGRAADKVADKLNGMTDNWGAVGAASSAALGSMNTAISKTNPLLGQAIGGVQKMIPILTQMASAAKQGGAALKGAFASTGIGLFIIAITEAVSLIEKVKEKANEASKDAAATAQAAIDKIAQANESFRESQLSAEEKYNHDRDVLVEASTAKWAEYYKKRRDGDIKESDAAYDEYRKLQAELATLDERRTADVKNANVERADAEEEAAGKVREAWAATQKEQEKALDSILGKYSKLHSVRDAIADVTNELTIITKAYKDGKIGADEFNEALKNIKTTLRELNGDSVMQKLEPVNSSLKNIAESATLAGNAISGRPVDSDGKVVAGGSSFFEDSKDTWGSINSMLTSTQQIMSNVTESYTSDIERQVAAGKLSAKEGKKRLKEQATLQASLSMAAGISASVYSMLEAWKSGPGGFIGKAALAVSSAAAVIGTTLSSVRSIKNAGEGLTDVSSSASPSVSATPTVSQTYQMNQDYNSSNDMANIANSIKSQQVVLVVDDVTKVQNTSTRVQAQASF